MFWIHHILINFQQVTELLCDSIVECILHSPQTPYTPITNIYYCSNSLNLPPFQRGKPRHKLRSDMKWSVEMNPPYFRPFPSISPHLASSARTFPCTFNADKNRTIQDLPASC